MGKKPTQDINIEQIIIFLIAMSEKKSGTKKKPKAKSDDKAKAETKKKDAGRKDAPKEEVVAEDRLAGLEIDPQCDYCKAIIYSGKAILCHCGKLVHQFCFNSHGMTKHQPKYTVVEVETVSVYDESGAYKGQRATYQAVANV